MRTSAFVGFHKAVEDGHLPPPLPLTRGAFSMPSSTRRPARRCVLTAAGRSMRPGAPPLPQGARHFSAGSRTAANAFGAAFANLRQRPVREIHAAGAALKAAALNGRRRLGGVCRARAARGIGLPLHDERRFAREARRGRELSDFAPTELRRRSLENNLRPRSKDRTKGQRFCYTADSKRADRQTEANACVKNGQCVMLRSAKRGGTKGEGNV